MKKRDYKKYMNEIRQRKALKMYKKYKKIAKREFNRTVTNKKVMDFFKFNRLDCLVIMKSYGGIIQ